MGRAGEVVFTQLRGKNIGRKPGKLRDNTLERHISIKKKQWAHGDKSGHVENLKELVDQYEWRKTNRHDEAHREKFIFEVKLIDGDKWYEVPLDEIKKCGYSTKVLRREYLCEKYP